MGRARVMDAVVGLQSCVLRAANVTHKHAFSPSLYKQDTDIPGSVTREIFMDASKQKQRQRQEKRS